MMMELDLRAKRDTKRWLFLALFCLAIGGLYALPLAAGRGLKHVSEAQVQHIFNIVLAVHVDLSIFLWFLAIILLMWRLIPCMLEAKPALSLPYFQTTSQLLFGLGALLMALSPFMGEVEGLRSNYIPMLTSHAFFISLACIACSLCLGLIETLCVVSPVRLLKMAFSRSYIIGPLSAYAAWGCALIVAVALAAFSVAGQGVDPTMRGEVYYDRVFWAGGHVIQFAYTQAAMLAWLLVAQAVGLRLPFGNRFYASLFSINLLAMLYVPIPFMRFSVDSEAFQSSFTQLMIWANGLSPAILMLVIVFVVIRQWRHLLMHRHASLLCLLSSILLFCYGGVLALMIKGQNVVIPAHYHGSIVGITLAMMGLVYALLPKVEWAEAQRWRVAVWQPVVLCAGQIIHVSALAWSGGYGVLRKTVGTDGYPPEVRVAMGLLGGGSGLASIGGAMFVIAVLLAMKHRSKSQLDNLIAKR
ncbi:MAG: cbb3-type cytochrome c oxidase subunit I [Rickettsiales bacterium]|nr:cbb3-type cytochrome c oxidase subunit I [Rickettsiales bacterium]